MYDNGELNVKDWPEARMLATKGKGFYKPPSAPLPTEPHHSDPTVKVPGQGDYGKEEELIGIWRAQEVHKYAQAAAQEQQEAAAAAESEAATEQLQHDNQVLRLEMQRLKGELHSYTVLEPEVLHLRKTNQELQLEIQVSFLFQKARSRLAPNSFPCRR